MMPEQGALLAQEESAEQIARAEQFLELAERLIGPIPSQDGEQT